MKRAHWMILTGEYPPRIGGVADYTQQVASALAEAGDRADVWTPGSRADGDVGQVRVHRLPDHFGPESLRILDRQLRKPDPQRIILVQYVPHAFGYRAMNVPFCAWLLSLRRQRIWTMFHEVAFPFAVGQRLRHQFLACVTHAMAFVVARASQRIFVSTPAWEPKIKRMSKPGTPIRWIPIPSNVPERKAEGGRQKAENTWADSAPAASNGDPIIAHFGAYGVQGSQLDREIVSVLRADQDVRVWLLGKGGETLADSIATAHPELKDRIVASGALSPQEIAERLSGADLVFQPYPDGVTTRRSSLMAALRLGRPTITTSGDRTEPIWRKSGAVELVDAWDMQALTERTIALLHDPPRRAELSLRARQLYDEHFDLRHTIAALRQAVEAP